MTADRDGFRTPWWTDIACVPAFIRELSSASVSRILRRAPSGVRLSAPPSTNVEDTSPSRGRRSKPPLLVVSAPPVPLDNGRTIVS
jgi:hypothetical protein